MVDFGREICGFLPAAERREWLITNGIGGFGMGTVAGLLTRRYHGLLIAALKPPLGRTLLLAKLDETIVYDGQNVPLFDNRWTDGTEEPGGYRHLERFHLDGTTPAWSFAIGDALLNKRVWMDPGANTTYIQYHLQRASAPLAMSLKALANYRDYHATTRPGAWQPAIRPVANGLEVSAFDGARPVYLLGREASFRPGGEWYAGFYLCIEDYRGQDETEDALFCAAHIETELRPGERLTIVATAEELRLAGRSLELDGQRAYAVRRQYEQELLARAATPGGILAVDGGQDPALKQLVLAADQFIVRRATPDDDDGRTVIAGYPWFSDWGRDTMIALPGLTLTTGRPADAANILRTFAYFVDRGMLPNRFPDAGEVPEYNTVDATLWFFEAIRAYHVATGDDALLADLFPVLQEIIAWHEKGTRFHIQLDPADGLIYAGQEGVQLTWMDAKVGDWVVTPRIGKPVEINALWYNALRVMAGLASHLGRPTGPYETLAGQAQAGFARFWNPAAGHCYDVLDGPAGDDDALRPNQLLAVSLPHSPLTAQQQKAVVDACARHLLTSHGLRSLAQDHAGYIGHYGGNQKLRDAAYHQGTVWGWLIGPFVTAHLRVYGDRALSRTYLQPLLHHLADHGLGSISEIFDGDPPFTPRGCPAQAWSVAELLRCWQAAS
jgi:predicted glycogen debranching enzyme